MGTSNYINNKGFFSENNNSSSDSSSTLVITSDITLSQGTSLAGGVASTSSPTTDVTSSLTTKYVFADATAGAMDVVLPDIASLDGFEVCIKKTDASGNAVTVLPSNGSQTIEGAVSSSLAAQYDNICLVSNDDLWWIF